MLLREAETDIIQRAKGDVLDGPCAVRDPVHVTTSFVRNLGELTYAREGNPGRLMKAMAER